MNKERFQPPANRQIVEEAAEWFVEINEGDADNATRQRFHAWLSLSPEHVRAYLKILPVWEEGAQLDTYANGDPSALIAWAKTTSNVVPWAAPPSNPDKPRAVYATARAKRFAIAATVLIAISGVVAWILMSRDVYHTGIGEQRLVALADGSKIELNSRSRLKVRFTEHERAIELIEGQALFSVAKEASRPFIVRSGDTSIRAVGTQFDVYRKKSGTTVTVVEGRVAVDSPSIPTPVVTAQSPNDSSTRAVTLQAGEQVIVVPFSAPEAKPANVSVATAWTQQQLVFFRTPLADVADEFNRYNKRQLVVKDERLKTFNVSGTFSSTDPTSLILFLQVQPGIQVNELNSVIEVEHKSQ